MLPGTTCLDCHLQQQKHSILHAACLGSVQKQLLCVGYGHAVLEPSSRLPLAVSPGFWSSSATSNPVLFKVPQFKLTYCESTLLGFFLPQILLGKISYDTMTFPCSVICPAYLGAMRVLFFADSKC